MDACTSSSPCRGTMGTSTVNKTLSATSSSKFAVTIKKSINNGKATMVGTFDVISGESFSTTIKGGSYYYCDSVSCTNSQVATIKEIFPSGSQVDCKIDISSVTNDTTCTVKMSS